MASRIEITETVTVKLGSYLAPINGARVQVNVRGGGAATVYAAQTGAATVPNPVVTVNGRIEGWLDSGSYDLVVSGTVEQTGIAPAGLTGYTQPYECGPTQADLDLVASSAAVSLKALGGDSTGVTAVDTVFATALATGRAIDLGGPENRWKLTTPVIRTTDLTIVGNGATLDMTSMALTNGRKSAIRVEGSPGTKTLLTANVVKAAKSVAVTSAAGLAVGDWVQIGVEADYYPHFGTNPEATRGEIKQILTISGLTVTFCQYVYDDYTTASSAFLRKLTMPKVNVGGFTIVSDDAPGATQEFGLDLYLCNDVAVDVSTQNINSQGVRMRSCIRFRVEGGIYSGSATQQATEDATFYGIGLYDACQWGRVYGVHAENLRRLGANSCHSAGQDYYGCPRFINVFGITGQHMKTELWEHHGFGEKIRVSDFVVDGCDGGIMIEGPGITVEGGQVTNWRAAAIRISSDTVDARDITIRDIDVWQAASDALASHYPVLVTLDNATTRRNVWIEDIRVHGWTQPSIAAVRVTGTGAVENCGSRNVRVRCSGAVRTTHAIDVDLPGWVVSGGSVWGAAMGVRLNGADAQAVGVDVHSDDATVGNAILLNAANQRAVGCTGRTAFAAVNIGAAATNWTVEGCAFTAPFTSRCIVNGSNVIGRAEHNSWELASGDFSVTAAANLLLPLMGSRIWRVNGTTQIDYLLKMADQTEVTLEFTAAMTVANGGAAAPTGYAPFKLAGAANFAATADDVLTLVYRASAWREKSRSVN